MTQNERIIRHLTDYGSITQGEALQEYGIMRLASRVNDLRRDGVPIVTEVVEGRNRYGEKTRFARYSLRLRRSEGASAAKQDAPETRACREAVARGENRMGAEA